MRHPIDGPADRGPAVEVPTPTTMILPTLAAFRRRIRAFAVLALLTALPALPGSAQTAAAPGVVVGQISNATTGANLQGVRVSVEGTNREVLTDRQGFYEIGDLAPG